MEGSVKYPGLGVTTVSAPPGTAGNSDCCAAAAWGVSLCAAHLRGASKSIELITIQTAAATRTRPLFTPSPPYYTRTLSARRTLYPVSQGFSWACDQNAPRCVFTRLALCCSACYVHRLTWAYCPQ